MLFGIWRRWSETGWIVGFGLALSAAWCSASESVGRGDAKVDARPPQVRKLMAPDREALYRRMLPQVDDREVAALLADPDLILYTDREMPPAYQDWRGDLQGVHSPSYNISANNSEPHGNGNQEFPWSAPAGTHRARGVETFRFVRLPRDAQGRPWPIVWYRKHQPGDSQSGYEWVYPVGTVFGEVLWMRGPDGRSYTFEMRLRIRESDDWGVDVFRPFPTAESLAQRVKELRPNWVDEPELEQLVEHLEQPQPLSKFRFVDRQPQRRVIDTVAGVDALPPVSDDRLVSELLTTTPFRSALGEVWRRGSNDALAFAPTAQSGFHVVPVRYEAGYIRNDSFSCARCHETVNRHVRDFNAARDWYGRVRGCDGIFSFHPFDPASISYNGYGQPVRMRSELTSAGLLVRYQPERHPRDVYTHLRKFSN